MAKKEASASQTTMDVVHVVWIDSHIRHGWIDSLQLQDLMHSDCLVNTVGLMIGQDEHWLAVAPTMSPGMVCDCMKIPMGAVKKIKKIGIVVLEGVD